MARPSRIPTVVVTGASSGIGRATAEAFARDGARLVLAARGEGALADAVAACRRLGADAIAVPTDVTDPAAVTRLATEALRFGDRIDVWVGNVGVGAVGRWQEVPLAAHEKVVRTNLIGRMNEAYAVVPVFLEQGAGVFINVISLGGFASTPFAAAYGASKFGLRGFGEALRAELAEHRRIHVCDVYPSFVDTPGIAHGANYTGRRLRVPPGALDPRTVADRIVETAHRPRPTVAVGPEVHAVRVLHALAPTLSARILARAMAFSFRRATPVALSDGNLHASPAVSGGIDGGERRPEERALIGLGLAALAATAAGLLVGASTRRLRMRDAVRGRRLDMARLADWTRDVRDRWR